MASREKKAKKARAEASGRGRGRAPRQTVLEFPNGWGGVRNGAGPKRKAELPQVPHRKREAMNGNHPAIVTLRIKKGLPSLRRKPVRRLLEEAIGAAQAFPGMRVVHYGFQSNHMHLIVEAEDEVSLAGGITGLKTRMARGLNKLWQRRGGVFDGRYHSRVLKTPREVRNAIAYVLRNCAHHGIEIVGVDPYSSGRWFDGWDFPPWLPETRAREPAPHLAPADPALERRLEEVGPYQRVRSARSR